MRARILCLVVTALLALAAGAGCKKKKAADQPASSETPDSKSMPMNAAMRPTDPATIIKRPMDNTEPDGPMDAMGMDAMRKGPMGMDGKDGMKVGENPDPRPIRPRPITTPIPSKINRGMKVGKQLKGLEE